MRSPLLRKEFSEALERIFLHAPSEEILSEWKEASRTVFKEVDRCNHMIDESIVQTSEAISDIHDDLDCGSKWMIKILSQILDSRSPFPFVCFLFNSSRLFGVGGRAGGRCCFCCCFSVWISLCRSSVFSLFICTLYLQVVPHHGWTISGVSAPLLIHALRAKKSHVDISILSSVLEHSSFDLHSLLADFLVERIALLCIGEFISASV